MTSWESLYGKVLVFHNPADCPCGVCKPRSALVGAVVSFRPLPPTERGAIPNAAVTVKGRSGKELVIDFVESRAAVFATWAEAIKSSEQ